MCIDENSIYWILSFRIVLGNVGFFVVVASVERVTAIGQNGVIAFLLQMYGTF